MNKNQLVLSEPLGDDSTDNRMAKGITKDCGPVNKYRQ